MKCQICKKEECHDDNNVCTSCSTSGQEYKQATITKQMTNLCNRNMTKKEAEKIIKAKIKELKPCPFCGEIPKIEYRVENKHSEHGSLGHFAKRKGCCKATGIGQVELFFCNNNEPADYELWKWMTCDLIDTWNKRIEN